MECAPTYRFDELGLLDLRGAIHHFPLSHSTLKILPNRFLIGKKLYDGYPSTPRGRNLVPGRQMSVRVVPMELLDSEFRGPLSSALLQKGPVVMNVGLEYDLYLCVIPLCMFSQLSGCFPS